MARIHKCARVTSAVTNDLFLFHLIFGLVSAELFAFAASSLCCRRICRFFEWIVNDENLRRRNVDHMWMIAIHVDCGEQSKPQLIATLHNWIQINLLLWNYDCGVWIKRRFFSHPKMSLSCTGIIKNYFFNIENLSNHKSSWMYCCRRWHSMRQ